jgi:hypothetical protein
MREKVTTLRGMLANSLRGEFDAARERGVQRLADGLAPYSRFVRAEQQKWGGIRATLAGWRGRATQLLAEIESGANP